MKIKGIVVIMEIKNWKVFLKVCPQKKNQPSNFCIDGTIICTIFGGGEPQQETIYSYWLASVSEPNLASNKTWKLRIKHVGVVNAEALEKEREHIHITY